MRKGAPCETQVASAFGGARNAAPAAISHLFLTHRCQTAPKGSALGKAALAARRYREAEFNNLEGRLRAELTAISPGIGVHLLPEATIPGVWPPADVLVTLPVNTNGTGVDLESGWAAWRALVDDGRKICVLPVMNKLGFQNPCCELMLLQRVSQIHDRRIFGNRRAKRQSSNMADRSDLVQGFFHY